MIRVGEAMIQARSQGAQAVIKAITSTLSGGLIVQGEAVEIRLETIGGYDVGFIAVKGDRKGELTFWNEFMTLEVEGRRMATFPDLITLLSLENGIPVSSAEVKKGDRWGCWLYRGPISSSGRVSAFRRLSGRRKRRLVNPSCEEAGNSVFPGDSLASERSNRDG